MSAFDWAQAPRDRMPASRTLVICLDAYDPVLGDRLMAQGRLPGLARLKSQSARFELEHGQDGKARYTGLTWEHFSSGRTPESAAKWSSISFDPTTYRAWQTHATERPFLAGLDARCVIFDAPYFDLAAMENAVGAVGWGGHDTGVHPYAQPGGLMAEINARFGAPPDVHALNTMVYPSVEQTAGMAAMLTASVGKRFDVADWLLGERFPEWDVAVVGVVETHDAVELMQHGVDPGHQLAGAPSAQAAHDGLVAVYEEISRRIEALAQRFPNVNLAAFTMHGMGYNDTDLPTMLLLPELMHRMSFGEPHFRSRADWRGTGAPMLRPGEEWNSAVIRAMAGEAQEKPSPLRRFAGRLRRKAVGALRGASHEPQGPKSKSFDVDWMPAMRYARFWPQMEAFSLPAYFDGRVRVNLAGRERDGRTPLAEYEATLDKVEAALRACVDIRTGEPVVREIDRPGLADPLNLLDTSADLRILWNGSPVGFRHPVFGDIGPGPIRRTGGHSGGYGALYVRSQRLAPGDYGLRSSFDVAPTVVDLLRQVRPNWMDGESVLSPIKTNEFVAAGAGA